MQFFRPAHAVAILVLLLSPACGGVTQYAEDAVVKNKDIIEAETKLLEDQVEAYKARKLVEFSDQIWIGSSAHVFSNSTGPLPAVIRQQKDVILLTALPVSLTEAGRRITELSGVPVFSELGGEAADNVAPIRYDGDLRGLLNHVAETFDAHWFYDEKINSITFAQLITRIFDFYAPPSNVAVSSSVGGGGSSGGGEGDGGGGGGGEGGGSEGGGSVSFSRTSSYDDWDDIETVIGDIMPDGSSLSLSPASGKITVTTTPAAMRRVTKIIRDRNEYLTRQIHVNIRVLEINITAEEDYAFDPGNININNLVRKALGVDVGSSTFEYNTGGNIFSTDGEAPGLIVNTNPTFDSAGNLVANPDNINLVFQALNKLGKVSVVTTANTHIRNGRPAPIESTASRSYVARISVAITETATATGIETDQFNTGLLMNLRPRILAREEIQMEMAINLRSLNALRQFSQGGSRVEQPDIATRSFAQEVTIPNGATLLLSGLERQANDAQKSGTGQADNLILGGARESEASRTTVVILITPTIVKN